MGLICEIAFFDLDGTIYLDGEPIGDIVNEICFLYQNGVEIRYLTNNTSVSLSYYQDKLRSLNLPVSEQAVISPLVPLSNWLKKNNVRSFYCVGTAEFVKDIEHNSDARHDPDFPEIVLVGFDKEVNYLKLKKACEFINNGLEWHVSNMDLNCPTKNGPIPDCGSIANLISVTTGTQPKFNFGKPEQHMVEIIRREVGAFTKVLVAGDRTYTDIKLGHKINALTVLVCSGEYSTTSDEQVPKGTHIYSTLSNFLSAHR